MSEYLEQAKTICKAVRDNPDKVSKLEILIAEQLRKYTRHLDGLIQMIVHNRIRIGDRAGWEIRNMKTDTWEYVGMQKVTDIIDFEIREGNLYV